jgi:activator of HSP90 ATPase
MNNNTKKSNEKIKGNAIADRSEGRDGFHTQNSIPIPNHNYGPFDFEINQEFIEENKKINVNLVRHRHNHKQKLLPLQGLREEREELRFTNYISNMGFPQHE